MGITAPLIPKTKFGFLDGSISKSELMASLTMKNVSDMVNSAITSWILNIIDTKLHTSVAYADNL